MEYLVVAREFYECDNNTPSDRILAKVAEFKTDQEMEAAKATYRASAIARGAVDATVEFYPTNRLTGDWEELCVIW